jgi:hypothetical protein
MTGLDLLTMVGTAGWKPVTATRVEPVTGSSSVEGRGWTETVAWDTADGQPATPTATRSGSRSRRVRSTGYRCWASGPTGHSRQHTHRARPGPALTTSWRLGATWQATLAGYAEPGIEAVAARRRVQRRTSSPTAIGPHSTSASECMICR